VKAFNFRANEGKDEQLFSPFKRSFEGRWSARRPFDGGVRIALWVLGFADPQQFLITQERIDD
jgi:hypothetical protein